MNEQPHSTMLMRLFDGGLTALDRSELDIWADRSEENRKEVEELSKLAGLIPAGDPRIQSTSTPDAEMAWSKVSGRMASTSNAQPHARMSPGRNAKPHARIFSFPSTQWITAAAVLAGVAVITLLLLRPVEPAWTQVIAARGQTASVSLEDGSVIKLNAESSIEYLLGETRTVRLEGEGYFEVESDGRPFVVQTSESIVRVLGTKFTVRSRDGVARVSVVEGRVSVEAPADTVVLGREEAVEVSAQGDIQILAPAQVRTAQAWTEGAMAFYKTSLYEALSEIERRFAIEVEVLGLDSSTETLTASFPGLSARQILDAICSTYGCEVLEDTSKKYILQAR